MEKMENCQLSLTMTKILMENYSKLPFPLNYKPKLGKKFQFIKTAERGHSFLSNDTEAYLSKQPIATVCERNERPAAT